MSDGFRKAFLGFNCSDVIEYIKKTHNEFSEERDGLNDKIKELETALSSQIEKTNEAELNLKKANETIEEYKAREDEITRISETIGKLYIVSQANARAVIENAEENRKLAEEEVNKNLAALKKAHEEISAVIKGVTDTSVDFTDNMKSLNSDLLEAAKSIEQNNEKSDKSLEETKSVLSSAK